MHFLGNTNIAKSGSKPSTAAVLLSLAFSVSSHAEEVVVWLARPASWDLDVESLAEAEARADIAKDRLRIFSIGLPIPDEAYDQLMFKYGLEDENLGCIPESHLMAYKRGYMRVVDAELERRYGKDFWKRFRAELVLLRDRQRNAAR